MTKMGNNHGPAFVGTVGAGQGDVSSVASVLNITTMELRHIDHRCPSVDKSCVVDDRTFRGPCQDVIRAVELALQLAKAVKNGKIGDEMDDGDHLTTGAVVLLRAPNSESEHSRRISN